MMFSFCISRYSNADIHIIGAGASAPARTFNKEFEPKRHSGVAVVDPPSHRPKSYYSDDVLATEV